MRPCALDESSLSIGRVNILITHHANATVFLSLPSTLVGLWDEKDGFYYDFLRTEGQHLPLRIRSYVGLVPLFAGLTIEQSHLEEIPGFAEKFAWFRTHRKEHAAMVRSY